MFLEFDSVPFFFFFCSRVAARWVNENVEEKREGGVTLSEVALDLDAMAIKVKANLVIEERDRVRLNN